MNWTIQLVKAEDKEIKDKEQVNTLYLSILVSIGNAEPTLVHISKLLSVDFHKGKIFLKKRKKKKKVSYLFHPPLQFSSPQINHDYTNIIGAMLSHGNLR
jgi:hypothetical protein